MTSQGPAATSQGAVATSQGPAQVDLTLPDLTRPGAPGAPSFLLALTHGAGGAVTAPDLLAVQDAAVGLGGAVALITQPYRVRGARAPGSAARQDEAWQEIIGSLRAGAWLAPDGKVRLAADLRSTGERLTPDGKVRLAGDLRSTGERLVLGRAVPLIVGGRSNGARVACRTAAAVGATGVIALAFPLRPPARGRSAGVTAAPSRDEELRSAASHAVQVLVVNGDKDPFGIPDPGDALRVIVLKGESHALSRNPAAVADAVTDWLSRLRPRVH